MSASLYRPEVALTSENAVIGVSGEVVLYVVLRFDEGVIAFDTFQNNLWVREEKVSLPFSKGQTFELRIR